MATVKNLVDALSEPTTRTFCPPIASDVMARPGEHPAVPAALLTPADEAVDGMPSLTVSIYDPLDQLLDQPGVPHEALRLHAIGRGTLTYRPVLGALQKCLVLRLAPFWTTARVRVKWLERWLEAGQMPRTFIYENVDEGQLRQMLQNLSPDPPSPANPAQPLGIGILMPTRVERGNATSKTQFIDDFMSGTEGAALMVRTGAIIGKIATSAPHTYRVRFHARYEGHTDAAPRPMHPRELFHLLFGNDSPEALNNALLKSIDAKGRSETALPRTKRMLLRPPLRTYFRVVWEAEQEFSAAAGPDGHEARWAASGALGGDLLTNTIPGFDRTNTYQGLFKCNVFASEMLLRSGFRVRMRKNPATAAGPETIYYYLANRIVGEARDTHMTLEAPGILATDGELPWGRRWDGVLHSTADADRAAVINRMMEEEGRAFYLVQEKRCVPITSCHGHVLLLERVDEGWPPGDEIAGQPTVKFELIGLESRGTRIGLTWIQATVIEAPADGLFRRRRIVTPEWPDFRPSNPASTSRNNDLLLIEAIPGGDPSTEGGLEDLCVRHQGG